MENNLSERADLLTVHGQRRAGGAQLPLAADIAEVGVGVQVSSGLPRVRSGSHLAEAAGNQGIGRCVPGHLCARMRLSHVMHFHCAACSRRVLLVLFRSATCSE